ncbi:MAG: endonuclease domain-containing protein [Candidatus Kerfeldbacteria bacterium]|nr:endonuclease domain-containing protein [Candidatus Kerfeldbacteria bacterium]
MLAKNKIPPEINFQKKLHYISRKLRAHSTAAEKYLWQFLRRKQILGLRFLRQHPIDRFIVDFVCYRFKIIIEVDGPIHLIHQGRDKQRDERLQQYGYVILRFSNDQVLHEINSVLAIIKQQTLSSLVREESRRDGI